MQAVQTSYKQTLDTAKTVPVPTWGIVTAVLVIGIVIWVPKWQTSNITPPSGKTSFEYENQARGTIVQAIGGVFFFVTAYFTWRNLKTTEKNYQIAEDKQVTERFSKAVEMLGNRELIEVRLGGIYTLERIGRDSSEDLWTVIEILTAFIRERSLRGKMIDIRDEFTLREWSANRANYEELIPEVLFIEKDTAPASLDIKAALNVLNRLAQERKINRKIDISYTNLSYADLSYSNFNKVSFQTANLSSTNFSYAKLTKPNFWTANLSNTKFDKSILVDADFIGVSEFEKASFYRALLIGSNFKGAILQRVDFTGSLLVNVDFRDVRDFAFKQLDGATFFNTALPTEIMNRNCDGLLDALLEKYPDEFKNIKAAEEFVSKARRKNWEL